MIVVQAIDCVYSKRDRGGAAADIRNRFPRVLSWSGGMERRSGCSIERWTVSAPNYVVERAENPASDLWIETKLSDKELHVWFRWNDHLGAPSRPRTSSPDFCVVPGSWGCMEFNGRVGWGNEWRYRHAVRNVALLGADQTMDPDIFLVQPASVHKAHLASLW